MELDFGILLTYARNNVPKDKWSHLPSDYKYDKLNLLESLVILIREEYSKISNGDYWPEKLKLIVEERLKTKRDELMRLTFTGRQRSATPIELEEEKRGKMQNLEKLSSEILVKFIESYQIYVKFENDLLILKSKK